MLFDVTYTITTPESAEFGEFAERGFIEQDAPLRYAVADLFATRTLAVDAIAEIEPNCSIPALADWITVYNGCEFETGAQESRSLHFPRQMTPSSRARLIRLLES